MTTLSIRVELDRPTVDRLETIRAVSGRAIEYVAAQRLRTGVLELPEAGRFVVVSGQVLEQLETILGGGSILSQTDLMDKVDRLAGISFLHVRLPFTPNQLEQLAEKAERNSLTVDQLVERTAPRIYEHFFDLVERS